jgi:adenylate cyclase class IV
MSAEALEYADFSVKARCTAADQVERTLMEIGAVYCGEDFQTDTYFEVPIGKLKLREGNIENLLTHYLREDDGSKMKTTVFVYEKDPDETLTKRYTESRPIIGRVVKRRKIFWIGNVKFHVDRFEGGKSFVEIEAIDRHGLLGLETIRSQAEKYQQLLFIRPEDVVKESYIDMR